MPDTEEELRDYLLKGSEALYPKLLYNLLCWGNIFMNAYN